MRARCLHLLVAATMVLACKSAQVPAPETLGAVSTAEAQDLATSLAAALGTCDEPALATLFDRQWLFRAAARASGLGAKQQRTLYQALQAREDFGRVFLCTADLKLVYLGLRETADGQSLVFRAADAVGPNYLEFTVGKTPSGKVRCVGRLEYRDGWALRDLLAMSSGQDELVAALAQMRESLADSPESVTRSSRSYSHVRAAQVLAVRAGARQGEAIYRSALASYLDRHPGDASIYAQVYDDLATAGLYGLADEAIVAWQTAVHDADGLLSKRVALMLEGGNFAQATQLAEADLLAHPEQLEAHYRLLEAHVEGRNFAGAVAIMRLMGERFNVRFTEESMDTSHPAYVDLLASDEWSAY